MFFRVYGVCTPQDNNMTSTNTKTNPNTNNVCATGNKNPNGKLKTNTPMMRAKSRKNLLGKKMFFKSLFFD